MAELSVITRGQVLEGSIKASEDLLIEGHVKGAIQSSAALTIAEGALVEGPILARDILVKGIVLGDISASNEVQLTETAQVRGHLRALKLSLKPGGRIQGQVETGVEVSLQRDYSSLSASSFGSSSRTVSRSTWEAPRTPSTSSFHHESVVNEVVEESTPSAFFAASPKDGQAPSPELALSAEPPKHSEQKAQEMESQADLEFAPESE